MPSRFPIMLSVIIFTLGGMTGLDAVNRVAAQETAPQPSASSAASAPLGANRVMDFDGDGKSDYAVIRDTAGAMSWYLLRSNLGFSGSQWGITSDVAVPADYDGDGKADIAVWRPGAQGFFYVLRSSNGTVNSIPFGTTNDDPRVTQDFDGDGKADPAVTRFTGSPATKTWFIQRSLLGFTSVLFGNTSDISIRGDYDGDGKADVAVYRTTSGNPANTFFVIRSSNGTVQSQTWGTWATDNVLPGDFDGDGKTDFAVFRQGTWYWLRSSDQQLGVMVFGFSNDQAAPGDYDGDGKTDPAVWRPNNSTFYAQRSMLGFVTTPFGITNDSPVANTLQVR
ncbi:MAG: VCBS repeat-containing protein [Pyrinomonadaceae bacterium]